MTTRAGVAFSENPNSFAAGAECAKAALDRAGTSTCEIAFLFGTGKHDALKLNEGVRSVLGDRARLVGGSAAGIITNDRLAYAGYQVGVAVLSSSTLKTDVFTAELAKGERVAGVELGEKLGAATFDGTPNVILMYDALRKTAQGGPPQLNLATPLLEGMSKAMTAWPPTAGVGLLGDVMMLAPPVQWVDARTAHQEAVAVALAGGGLRMDTLILHGCRPSSGYHKVTKAEGNAVLELDGKPALDVISELMGPGVGLDSFPLFVTLGVNKGEKFADFAEENYANRLCLAVDKERRALIMFEPDLIAGSEVQLMRRAIGFDYIGTEIGALLERLGDRKPLFALYIDCLGRAGAYCGMDQEEAAEVQQHLKNIPLLGVYSGVEIARVGKDMQALDWTGVLCVFSE
jgi:hypothetical protein